MPLLQICAHPGCTVLTIGELCLEHEPVRESRTFPRGRPFPPVARDLLAPLDPTPALVPHDLAAGLSYLST